MNIEIHLPRPTEAKVTVDDKKGLVTVEPFFDIHQNVHPYAYVRVVGSKGVERKYALCVSGKTGMLTSRRVKHVTPKFDKLDTLPVTDEEDEKDEKE